MRAKRRVVRDEHSRGNYALVALVSLLAVLTVGSFIVQTSESPLYSAKPRIVAEGGSGSGATADLTITEIIIPNGTYAGIPITISAVVKNVGNYPAAGRVSIFWNFSGPIGGFGGEACCQNISLSPGQATNIYQTFTTYNSGLWNVTSGIGAQDFMEQNYNNNMRTETFNVVSVTNQTTCYDSDGINYYLRGYTQGTPVNQSSYGNYTDTCSLSGLFEYYCQTIGSNQFVNVQVYNCPNGCSAGACLAAGNSTGNSSGGPGNNS